MNLTEIRQIVEGWKTGEIRTVHCGDLNYGKLFDALYDVPIATGIATEADKVRLKSIIDAWNDDDSIDTHFEELLELLFGKEERDIEEYFGCNPFGSGDSDAAASDVVASDVTANYLRSHSSELILMDLSNFLRNLVEVDKQLALKKRAQTKKTTTRD